MSFWDRIFKKKDKIENFLELRAEDIGYDSAELNVMLTAYAIHVIIDMISSIVSNIEFKTYGKDAEEEKKSMWIKLNLHPNRNQNSTEFLKELTKKMLLGDALILEIDEQYIIADDFDLEERAVKGNIFRNVTRGQYTFKDKNFDAEDVVYLKYSNSAVEAILSNIMEIYGKLIDVAAEKYRRSSEEKGILKIDQKERGDPNFKATYAKIVEKDFKTFFSKGNHVLPLFSGYDYISSTSEGTKKYSNEISDVKTLFEDALTRVAQAFKVPVGLIRGDVAGIKDAYTMLLTNCIDPIAHMISEEFTYKMFSEEQIMQGYAIEADTTCIKHIDIFDLATSIDKLIASGFLSIDEVRNKSGLRGLGEEYSEAHYMTLNYTTAEAVYKNGGQVSAVANNEGGEEGNDV